MLQRSALHGTDGQWTRITKVQLSSSAVAARLRRGEVSNVIESARGDERALAAALPGRRTVFRASAWAAGAAALMAVALGTDAQGGSRGRGRMPSPRVGYAGPACRARSRAMFCGVRRGPGWPHVDSASGPPLWCPCSLLLFLFPKVIFQGS